MKILSVGDSHGSSMPLSIAKKYLSSVDKIVFEGDYVDSFNSKWETGQEENLNNILAFKKENPDKVVLLWGNHDFSYISDSNVSGHQQFHAMDIGEFFKKNFDLFDIVFIQDKWIFSHAGVSQAWLDDEMPSYMRIWENEEFETNLDPIPSVYQIKDWFTNSPMRFDHRSGDPCGDNKVEGCLWIRPASLLLNGVEGFNQVVGHTEFEDKLDGRILITADCLSKNALIKTKEKFKNRDEKYVFVDSEKRNCYAIIDTSTNEVNINLD